MNPPYHIACTRIIDAQIKQEANSRGLIVEDKELIHIDLLDSPEVVDILRKNTFPIIFTSQYGVQAVHKLIQKYQIELAEINTYCISGKTAKIAAEAGFRVKDTALNSNLLAKIIVAAKDQNSFLHAGTNLALTEWVSYLSAHQINIKTIQVYHKSLHPQSFAKSAAVLFFSPSQIDAFLQVNTLDEQTPAFCIGETTAGHLSETQHKNIIKADEPNEQAVFKLVYSYFN